MQKEKRFNLLKRMLYSGTAKKSLLVMLFKAVGIVLGYILTILISKKFGAVGLGVYSIAYTTIIIYGHVASVGLNTSILRFMGEYSKPQEENKRRVLYLFALAIILLSSLVLSCIIFFFSGNLAIHLLRDATFEPVLRLISLAAPLFTLNLINIEYLRGNGKIGVSEVFRTIAIPVLTIVFILLFINNESVQIPIYSLSIAVCIVALVSFSTILSNLKIFTKFVLNEINIAHLLRISYPMMFVALGSYFISNMSIYILQNQLSTFEVGVFALCLKFSLFISFILIGVNTVIAPKLAKFYWAGQREELNQLVRENTKLIFWTSSLPFLILIIFPATLLSLINAEFVVGKWVLVILALGQFINAFCGPVGLLLNMTGNEKSLMKVTLAFVFITLLINVVFVKLIGILGAAIATATSIALKNLILVRLSQKKLNINTLYIPLFWQK